MNRSPAELTSQIAALDDGRAIAALCLVLERQGQPVDPIDLRETQDHLEQALHQPGVRQLADPDQAATPGALARTALDHLAAVTRQPKTSSSSHHPRRRARPARSQHARRRRPGLYRSGPRSTCTAIRKELELPAAHNPSATRPAAPQPAPRRLRTTHHTK